jgi:formamidopyrimidine-DNA glycosylase
VPELPEVETIARGLATAVTGKTISAAEVTLPKVVSPDAARFARDVRGERIDSVGRRGKFVVVGLSSGRSLVVHLRMTGRLIVQTAGTTDPYPYTKVRLAFDDGTHLCFADVRQFGRMRLVEPGEPWDAGLGPEPLAADFTVERFGAVLRGRPTPIKVFLLDQRRIAGVGNIYACEALWEARIRPTRPARSLSPARRARLFESLRSVLRRAIHMGGTSARDYVNAAGVRGGFQNELAIYGRDGEACPRCGGPIVRTVIAQRGTWWCRSCQRS